MSAGAAASGVGAGLGAIGTLMSGSAAYSSGMYNSTVAKQNQQLALEAGSIEQSQQVKQTEAKLGQARAEAGASGVQSGSGSALDILRSNAAQSELDNIMIGYNAQIKALGFQDQAQLDAMGAENARQSSYFGAAGQLFGGAGQAYAQGAGSGRIAPESGFSYSPEEGNAETGMSVGSIA